MAKQEGWMRRTELIVVAAAALLLALASSPGSRDLAYSLRPDVSRHWSTSRMTPMRSLALPLTFATG